MTDPMTALVRRAAQRSDDEIAGLTGSAAETDLMARILAEPAPVPAPVRAPAHVPVRRRRRRRLIALTGLVAAATVGISTLVAVQGDDGDRVAWAAEAIELADHTPRLLIDADGWQIENADQIEPDEGTVWLTDGELELYLRWYVQDFDVIVANRDHGDAVRGRAVVAGHEAVTLSWPDDERTTLWQQSGFVVEMVTWRSPMSDDEYADVLAAITQVDAETWLSALPGDVIRPEDVVAIAEDMLGGAALPGGLAFTEPAGVISRHQLSYTIEGEARCAWIEEWIRATDAGDQAAAEAAVTALAGVPDWPVQDEIHGHDASAFWAGLDRIVDDGVLPGGRDLVISGDTEVEGWRAEFGCTPPSLLR